MNTLWKYRYNLFVGFFATTASIASWLYSYTHHLVLLYNDAMSHLDLARLVIDDKQTGLTQIGGVWLPLNHILALLLVWNNWAWHSGFAGSFFSMLAYVITDIVIFLSVKRITRSALASVVASLAYGLNPNILYLQSTPLTEPLYLLSFVLSFYFFLCWVSTDTDTYLILLGFSGILQTMIRYDGWFITGIEALLIASYILVVQKKHFSEMIAKVLLFAYPIMFSCGLWFLWNLFVFHDPLFFLLGHYSAHSQQFYLEHHSGLITKHNVKLSFLAYTYAILDNAGKLLVGCSILGAFVLLLTRKIQLDIYKKILLILFLLSPVIFNILSLYEGFSTLNIPELHWNPSPSISGEWFNVRYGILVMPFCAVMVGLLATAFSRLRILVFVALTGLIFFQSVLLYEKGLITVIDGAIGSSSFANKDISVALGKLVKKNDSVLLSTANYNAVAFTSGLDLHQFVHEGVSNEWSKALVHPENYVKWIVMANGDIGEPAFTSLIRNQKGKFLQYYKLVYTGQHANIYELKSLSEMSVRRENSFLLLGQNRFWIKGVNDYDLAYQSSINIHQTFQQLHAIGVTTVRFWLFGDGFANGFQPKAGAMNENRFAVVDYIITQAKKYNIRLIPVLLNNWNDYGGKRQYLAWVGKKNTLSPSQFYTNPSTIKLFENYIDHVLSRRNLLTHTSYSQDPTILAWDIINEPRIENGNMSALTQWAKSMASYIKSHDTMHLITIGTETISPSKDVQQPPVLCKLKEIDICSLHLYIYSDTNRLLYSSQSAVTAALTRNSIQARQFNKPAFIEEMGIPKQTKPFYSSAFTILKAFANFSVHEKFNGFLIWNWAQKADTSFGFSPNGTHNIYSAKDLEKLLRG